MTRLNKSQKRKLEGAESHSGSSKRARQDQALADIDHHSPPPDAAPNLLSKAASPAPQSTVKVENKSAEQLESTASRKKRRLDRAHRKKTSAQREARRNAQTAKDEEEMRSAIGTHEYFDAIIDMQDDLALQSEAEAAEREREREEAQMPLEERERRAKERRKLERQARKAEKKRAAEALRDGNGTIGHGTVTARNGADGDAQQAHWTLSPPMAGRYLDVDPAFLRGDDGREYLVTANSRNVQLLSLDDSLLVRSCAIPEGKSVVTFAVSSERADMVYIALDDGALEIWDWEDSTSSVGLLYGQGSLKALTVATDLATGEEFSFYLATVDSLSAVCMGHDSLHTTSYELRSLWVLGDMTFIIAQGPSVVLLGIRSPGTNTRTGYTWLELAMPTNITCFDVRLKPVVTNGKKDRSRRAGLSLAVGNGEGQIHLYDDVSSIFSQTERLSLPPPRILHWHREAVNTVKFSRDGNYLISGGNETVLVLWQLQTGKKQFLPHLTSVIERVVVSPTGDRYAVQMGDNSIMVLSTSELKPVANFAGLQLASRSRPSFDAWRTTVLHPHNPNQILLTVPASIDAADARPFLQTFDTRTSRHVTRQALTRNNVTDFNLGPERTPIVSPDVAHLQISHDGRWLATIDEWMPPASDLDHLAADSAEVLEEREKRREVYLKFWQWDEVQNMWVLATRVDSPHARAGDPLNWAAGRVLQLITQPRANGFATIGEDGRVKIWKPKTKMRHGVIMTDANDQDVIEWTCKRTIELPKHEERADSLMHDIVVPKPGVPIKACLAYSEDGSMLAAAVTQHDEAEVGTSLLHFINAHRGAVAATKAGLLPTSEIYALGILDRYLIVVVHQDVQVWDLIEETLRHHHIIPLGEARLTLHPSEGTYAIAVDGKISVYRPNVTSPVCKLECESNIVAVLAAGGQSSGRGYTLLCEDATVRTLASTGPATSNRLLLLQTATKEQDVVPAVTISEVEPEAMDTDAEVEADNAGLYLLEEAEDDRPVVRPEQLANVFDVGQSFAMPPVKDMFEAVVGLFGRRPHESDASAMVAAMS